MSKRPSQAQIQTAIDLRDNFGAQVKRGTYQYQHSNGRFYTSTQKNKMIFGGTWEPMITSNSRDPGRSKPARSNPIRRPASESKVPSAEPDPRDIFQDIDAPDAKHGDLPSSGAHIAVAPVATASGPAHSMPSLYPVGTPFDNPMSALDIVRQRMIEKGQIPSSAERARQASDRRRASQAASVAGESRRDAHNREIGENMANARQQEVTQMRQAQSAERLRELNMRRRGRTSNAPINRQAQYEGDREIVREAGDDPDLVQQPAYSVGLGRRKGKGQSRRGAVVGLTMSGQPIHNRAGAGMSRRDLIQRGGDQRSEIRLGIVRPDPLPLYLMQGFGKAPLNPILDGRKYKGKGIRVFPLPI